MVRCAATAAESVSGAIVTFDLLAGEISKVVAGDTLAVIGAADATGAHVVHVIAVDATSQVTAYNGYLGSPAVASTDLNGAVFENLPSGAKSEWDMYQAVEAVINRLLWPDLFDYATYAITPDLTDYQVELNAAVEKIVDAVQVVGTSRVNVPFTQPLRDQHSGVSSTGVLAEIYAVDGTTVWIKTINRITASSTLDDAFTEMIATGAAAICAGKTVNAKTMEAASKEAQSRETPNTSLWRDFVTLRQAIIEDFSRQENYFEIVR
jgi:hypothetical protein